MKNPPLFVEINNRNKRGRRGDWLHDVLLQMSTRKRALKSDLR